MREIQPDVVIIYKEQKSAVVAYNLTRWQIPRRGIAEAGEKDRDDKKNLEKIRKVKTFIISVFRVMTPILTEELKQIPEVTLMMTV